MIPTEMERILKSQLCNVSFYQPSKSDKHIMARLQAYIGKIASIYSEQDPHLQRWCITSFGVVEGSLMPLEDIPAGWLYPGSD